MTGLPFARDGRLAVLRGDITAVQAEALVNAANAELAGGGGVDGAIHRAAGPGLAEACAAIRASRRPGPACPQGEAVATPGFGLRARWIIHTVGPVWGRQAPGEADALLASCYRRCLDLARELGAASIAFPNVSTGVYGFPRERAARVAVEACLGWLAAADADAGSRLPLSLLFVCFDAENEAIYRAEAPRG